jgi:hypothetical protein
VERVGGHSAARDLADDLGAASHRVLGRLEDDNRRAFAEDEAVAVAIERAGCVSGIVVAARKSAHVAESGEGDRQKRAFRTADERDVHFAVADHPHAVDEGDDAAGAGCDLGDDRAGDVVLHRDLAGRHRAGEGRDGERRNLAGALVGDDLRALEITCSSPPPPVFRQTATRSR